ncbi:MAG TPA: hypothetical protein VKV28_04855 [Candidatus Binataceae bacterium]|nr:hypothetical protein [Candidatus Binataceae bacterium]
MSNNYYSTQETAGIQAVYETGAFVETFSFAIPAVGFGVGDTVTLLKIPAYCALIDFAIDCPQLDSAGSPTVTIDLGDGGNSQRYIAAGALGRSATDTVLTPSGIAGSAAGNWQQGALPHRYAAADNLVLKIHAAPTTPTVSGTITGHALFWGGQNQ